MGQIPSTAVGTRRRSQRVLMQVGVVIRGTDAHGRKFEEETETHSVNAHGALVLVGAKLITGATVVLQHKHTQEEQECVVVFLGAARGGKTEIGLNFSSPRPGFWRVIFPPEDWTPKHPDARSLSFREK